MADTKDELCGKSHGCFLLAVVLTLGAAYLSLVDLPHAKVHHARLWLVLIAVVAAVLISAVGVWERDHVASAPDQEPQPDAAQVAAAQVILFLQAGVMSLLCLIVAVQDRVGLTVLSLISAAAFAGLATQQRRSGRAT